MQYRNINSYILYTALITAILLLGSAGLGLSAAADTDQLNNTSENVTNGTALNISDNRTVEITQPVWEAINETKNKTGSESPNETVIVRLEPVTEPNSTITRDSLQTKTTTAQQQAIDQLSDVRGLTIQRSFWIMNALAVEINTKTVDLTEIASVPGVQYIHDNFVVNASNQPRSVTSEYSTPPTVTTPPTLSSNERLRSPDPEYSELAISDSEYTWALEQIEVPLMRAEFDTTGDSTRVAVLDTGVDTNHSDISVAGWQEFDTNGNRINSTPMDYGEHGTAVSGIVAGDGAASSGQYGVAPATALYHGAVLTECDDGTCSGTFAQVVAGMEWAAETDVDVVSMSLGGRPTYTPWVEPVRNTQAQGTFVVAAIGNGGAGTSTSPGDVYDSIGVGATDDTGDVVSFSGGRMLDAETDWDWSNSERFDSPPQNWPEEYVVPTLVAPGQSVTTAVPGDTYASVSGTSFATPHVAGAAVLLASYADEALTPSELRELLQNGSWRPSDTTADLDTRYGHGITSPYRAAVDQWIDAAVVDVTVTEENYVPGDTVESTLTIENTGERTKSFTIEQLIRDPDGTLVSEARSTVVTDPIAPGETDTVSVTWQTNAEADPGGYDLSTAIWAESQPDRLTVELDTQYRENAVSIVEPATTATFDVQITDTNAPLTAGEQLAVSATISNTGDGAGVQTIALSNQRTGDVCAEDNISLDPGADKEVTLSCPTTADDIPGFDVVVASENDTASRSITVTEPGVFEIINLNLSTASIYTNETVVASATITNTGGPDTQIVTLSANNTSVATRSVTLDRNTTGTVELVYQPKERDTPTTTLKVSTPADAAERLINVTSITELYNAQRTIETPIIQGNSSEIAIDITTPGGKPFVVESFDPVPPSFSVVDIDPFPQINGLSDDRTEFVTGWGVSSDTYTIRYEFGTNQTADTPYIYNITGTITVDGIEIPISGDSTIEVITQPASPSYYADESTGKIEASGLRTAFKHWQRDIIAAKLLSAVFNSWQSGTVLNSPDT